MNEAAPLNLAKHMDHGLLRFAIKHLAKKWNVDYDTARARQVGWLEKNPHPEDRAHRRPGGYKSTAQDVKIHREVLREHGGVMPMPDPLIRDEYGREMPF